MIILAVNSSYTTLQFLLVDSDGWNELAHGSCVNIGSMATFNYTNSNAGKVIDNYEVPTHREAIMLMLKYLVDDELGVVEDYAKIDAVGHRIAHGGDYFVDPVLITKDIVDKIKSFSEQAPMDNPINLVCVSACREKMPNTPMIAVFDTGFHNTIMEKAYLYSIPYAIYENFGVRKYGFRGSSHKYVSSKMAEFLGADVKNFKQVICHLGSETSICAVENGISIDSSTGFTPMSGIGMATRSGDMDPYVVAYLAGKMKIDTSQVIEILSRKSGLLGLTNGLSSDIREIEKTAIEGNELSKKALEVYSYNIAKAICSCILSLNGVDAIAFTAGVGENSSIVRKAVCSYLQFLGVSIDEEKNNNVAGMACISKIDSKVAICVIPTNEEYEICKETYNVLQNMKDYYKDR